MTFAPFYTQAIFKQIKNMSCTENLSQLKAADFKKTVDGKETALFILKNKQGSEVAITNYGVAIAALQGILDRVQTQ